MKEKEEIVKEELWLQDFPIDVKRDIVDILNDTPSLVRLGEREYKVKNIRPYALNRIFRIAIDLRKADEGLDTDNKILTAMCTDLDAMCEIIAIIIVNHLFTPDGVEDMDDAMSRNDRLVSRMKMKVMNSTFEPNQWAAIVLGAIKSVDWGAFFLLIESVNMVMDSHLMRKKKSAETASQFMEALSLQTLPTS